MSNTFDNEFIKAVVSVKDVDGYNGICLKTNKQEINFLIDNFQNCCESFGVKLIDENGATFGFDNVKEWDEKLRGERLISITWCHDNCPCEEDHRYASFKVTTESTSFKIEIFNHHNGYYPHSYKVNWNDFNDEDEL